MSLMLINEKEVEIDFDNPFKIFSILQAAPSGFSKRTNQDFSSAFDTSRPEYQKAVKAFKHADDCRWENMYDEAITSFEKASALYEQIGDAKNQCRALGNLYELLGEIFEETQDPEILSKIVSVRKSAHKAVSKTYCNVLDKDAYRFEVNEFAITQAGKPSIGTDTIYDCLTFFIRDPISTKMEGIHFSCITVPESLETVARFLKMPKERSGEPFLVRLLGARKYSKHSEKNVLKVMKFLSRYHVHIISCDILNTDSPVAVVADPNTYNLKEAVPIINLGTDLQKCAYGRIHFNANVRLNLAYDLTCNTHRDSVLIYPDLAQAQKERLGQKKHVYYNFSTTQRPPFTENALTLRDSYDSACKDIVKSIDPSRREVVAELLELYPPPIYISDGARSANQPLIEFLQTQPILKIEKELKALTQPNGNGSGKSHPPTFTIYPAASPQNNGKSKKVR